MDLLRLLFDPDVTLRAHKDSILLTRHALHAIVKPVTGLEFHHLVTGKAL